MSKPLSEDEAAARRERLRKWRQAYDAARQAQGICVRCGQANTEPSEWRGYCRACRERKRDISRTWWRARAAAERKRRETALRAELEARGTPACPRCGRTSIERLRQPREGRTFRCRDCKAAHQQTVPAARGGIPFPCPYCQGRCWKAGFDRRGKQSFVCTACGKYNTLLRADNRARGTTPALRHHLTLIVGLASDRALTRYCAARQMNMSQAVREIFRKYTYPATSWVLIRKYIDAWGEEASVITKPPRVKAPLRFTEATLPNLLSASMTARRQQQIEQELLYLPRPVGVVRCLTILLDDEAWEGLHRMMEILKKNHQDTARWMIEQQRL